MGRKVTVALEALGLTAEGYAKANTPVGTPESTGIKGYMGGTLRNSISHATQEDTAYIGTNVKYAKYVEFNDSASHITGRAHFLRDSVSKHDSEYKQMIESILKE